MYRKLDKYYQKHYGISWAQRMETWKLQGGRCAICGKHERRFKRRLSQDHDHKTGKTRGLLCFPCNRFKVGRLNSTDALRIFLYLSRHGS